MNKIDSEADFQAWVLARFEVLCRVSGPGHFQDFSSMDQDIPDVNMTLRGREFWLELKFNRFKMLHSGYDRFRWKTMQSGQLEWLRNRGVAGATVGVLGYAITTGDHPTGGVPYLIFHTVKQYESVVGNELDIGAVVLGAAAVAAHYVKTGPELLKFIDYARAGRLYNAVPL